MAAPLLNDDCISCVMGFLPLRDALAVMAATGIPLSSVAPLCAPLVFPTAAESDGSLGGDLALALLVRKHARLLRRVETVNLSSSELVWKSWCGVSCSSGALRAISCLPKLAVLDLSGRHLSSDALRALSGLPGLSSLNVTGCTFTVTHSSWGRANVRLDPPLLRAQASAPPAFASSLTTLIAVNTMLVPRVFPFAVFENCAALTASLSDPSSIVDIARCSRLRRLHLVSTRLCTLRIHGAAWRSVLSGLTELRLERCDLLPRAHLLQQSGEVLREALWHTRQLSVLALIDTPRSHDALLTDGGLLDASLPALRRARGGGTGGGAPVINTGLVELDVRPSAVLGDAGLVVIAAQCGATLRVLRLGPDNPRVTDAGLTALAAGCPLLASLDLPFAHGVTDAGVEALAASECAPHLTRLTLTRAGIMSAAPLEAIAARCSALRYLRLWGCHAAVQQQWQLPQTALHTVGLLPRRAPLQDGEAGVDVWCAPGLAALRALGERGVRVLYDAPPQQQQQQRQQCVYEMDAHAVFCDAGSSEDVCGRGVGTACGSSHDVASTIYPPPSAVVVALVTTTTPISAASSTPSSFSPSHAAAAAARLRAPSPTATDAAAASPLPCSFGCGVTVDPLNALDHVLACPCAPVVCPNEQYGCTVGSLRPAAMTLHLPLCPAWVVSCPLKCGADVVRSEMEAHLVGHVAAQEAAAATVYCPLADRGCAFGTPDPLDPAAAPGPASASSFCYSTAPAAAVASHAAATTHLAARQAASAAVALHLSTPHGCELATYVCTSCGVEAHPLAAGSLYERTVTCGTPVCAVLGLLRGRMGAINGIPPPVLLRGIPIDLLTEVGWAPTPELAPAGDDAGAATAGVDSSLFESVAAVLAAAVGAGGDDEAIEVALTDTAECAADESVSAAGFTPTPDSIEVVAPPLSQHSQSTTIPPPCPPQLPLHPPHGGSDLHHHASEAKSAAASLAASSPSFPLASVLMPLLPPSRGESSRSSSSSSSSWSPAADDVGEGVGGESGYHTQSHVIASAAGVLEGVSADSRVGCSTCRTQ